MNPALDCSSILIPLAITVVLILIDGVVTTVEGDANESVVVTSIIIGILVWAIWLIYAVVTLSKVASIAVAT